LRANFRRLWPSSTLSGYEEGGGDWHVIRPGLPSSLHGSGATPPSPQAEALHEMFYSTWYMPDNPAKSCCNKADCYPTEIKYVSGSIYARRREAGNGESCVRAWNASLLLRSEVLLRPLQDGCPNVQQASEGVMMTTGVSSFVAQLGLDSTGVDASRSVGLATTKCQPRARKHQVCDHCGGRFGMVTHRWWGSKFCKRTCKDAYESRVMLDRNTLLRWLRLTGPSRQEWSTCRAVRSVTSYR
jgi:hypothetical protein